MSATLRSRHAAAPPTQWLRKVSDQENQVIPFHLDDGVDDNEEIRRRRYSSSGSSASEPDASAKRGGRGGIRGALGRSRGGGSGSARRPHARSSQESEWDKASSGRAENEDGHHTSDSDSDHEPPRRMVAADAKARRDEKPESPCRTSSKKTQQSESASDRDEDDGEEEEHKESSAATTVATATSSPASVPRALAANELAGLSKLAVFPGSEHQLVQAYVRRVKTLLHSQYHFFINEQLVLMAEKQPKSRTPNYHLFDMTRAASGLSSRLTKKSGNYIGKVRSNFSKKKSVLIGHQSRKTELGAVLFSGNVSSSEPRRVVVVLPPLNAKRQEVDGIAVGDEPDIFSILVEHYKELQKQRKKKQHAAANAHHVQVFENKQPVFENGFYRLNFHGRVSVPSVKNFQLVQSEADQHHAAPMTVPKTAVPTPPSLLTPAFREEGAPVYLQFGKVDDNKFHLDFRAPITPIQAFAIALAQFNL